MEAKGRRGGVTPPLEQKLLEDWGGASLCCAPEPAKGAGNSLRCKSLVPRLASAQPCSSGPLTDPGPRFLWLSPWGTRKSPSWSGHSVPWVQGFAGDPIRANNSQGACCWGFQKVLPAPLALESRSLCWPGAAGSISLDQKVGPMRGRENSGLFLSLEPWIQLALKPDLIESLDYYCYRSCSFFFSIKLVRIRFLTHATVIGLSNYLSEGMENSPPV